MLERVRDFFVLPATEFNPWPIIVDWREGVCPQSSEYISSCSRARFLSLGTVADIAYILCDWLNFLRSEGISCLNCEGNELFAWIVKDRSRGIGSRRIRRKIAVVADFYLFLSDDPRYQDQVAQFNSLVFRTDQRTGRLVPRIAGPRGPKLKNGPRPIPDDDDVRRILGDLGGTGVEYCEVRNWLIGSLAADCGLRAAGIASLKLSDIDDMLFRAGILEKRCIGDAVQPNSVLTALVGSIQPLRRYSRRCLSIRITEKGNRHRMAPVTPALAEQLILFIVGVRETHCRKLMLSSAPNDLFLSQKGGKLRAGSIKDILKDAFVRAGVEGSGHSLRAFCITSEALRLLDLRESDNPRALDEAGLVARLMELAGHQTSSSLRHYLSVAHIRRARIGET